MIPSDPSPKPAPGALARVEPAQLAALAPLVEAARGYAEHSRSRNTQRAYQSDWRAFQTWCGLKGLDSLPATPAAVAVYLAALAGAGRKPSTVARALSGIIHAQKQAGYRWEKGNPVVQDVLKGIRRTWAAGGGKLAQKTPVGEEHLALLLGGCEETWEGVRDRAIISTGWHGAFRRSEIVALDAEDLTFGPDGVVVHVRMSKTDQEGRGEYIGLPFSANESLCPVLLLRAHLDGATSGPIFCARSGKRLPAAEVASAVQRAAKRAGLSQDFAGHSLRSGFATTAAEHGVGLDGIMRQGRWKDPATCLRYIRSATVFKNNAAKGLT